MLKKIKAYISLWVKRCLSRGGRIVLLKSVLQSILFYWTSISKVPKGILKNIWKFRFDSYLWKLEP
jgi:hypothetical protein